MGNIMDISAAGKSCRHHALKYAAMGWHVFPIWGATDGACDCGEPECKSPGKHPISHLVPRGMNDASCNPDAIRVWFDKAPNANIGINLVRSGLVAVDVDPRNGGHLTMELIEADASRPIASDVLAFTQGGGEHRFFNLPQDAGIQLPGTLGKGIDLKRNGYVVAAPSCGVQGCYDWEASSSPLDGAIPTPLPDWIRGLSAPSSAAPTKAQMESVGYSTVTKAQVAELRLALEHITDCDDRDTWLRVIGALRGLGSVGWELAEEWSKRSEKYDPADQAKKWHETRGWAKIEYQTVFHMAMERGWENQVIVPAVDASTVTVVKPQERKTADLPASLRSLPGPLQDGIDWFMQCSPSPQIEYAVMTMLGLGSVALGRRYVTNADNHSSMFFMALGTSGSGKESIKKASTKVLRAATLDRLIGATNFTNDTAVLKELRKKPAQLAMIDEFGAVLEAGRKSGNSLATMRRKALTEAFSSADGTLAPQAFATDIEPREGEIDHSLPIENPALTLMAISTPSSVFDNLEEGSLIDGFLNRFLVLTCNAKANDNLKRGHWTAPPASLINWMRSMRGLTSGNGADAIEAPFNEPQKMKVIKFRDDAWALLDGRNGHKGKTNDRAEALAAAGLSELWRRATEIAMRLSLILAKADGASYIEKSHVAWAIKMVDHCTSELVGSVSACMGGEVDKAREQMLRLIGNAGPNGMTASNLRRDSRMLRALEERQVGLSDRVLSGMVKEGLIAKVKVKGKSAERYVSTSPDADGES